MLSRSAAPASAREPLVAKVPEITVLFWVVKVLTTGMGEAAADYLGKVSLALAGGVGVLGFVVALWLQFRVRRYLAPVYWFAVAMVAVFGTMAADGVHVVLGVPYPALTAGYAGVLAAVFLVWRRSEGTLSIHGIVTRRRERYYWLTVLITFALGTAAGDLTAMSLHLGFAASALLFAAAIAVPALAWWRLRLDGTVAFWSAYVLTRPLGASVADWLGKPPSVAGGLGWGDGVVTMAATVLILVLVGVLTISRRDVQRPADADGPRPTVATGARASALEP
jgi:uncharacterized membrane-anchored protein